MSRFIENAINAQLNASNVIEADRQFKISCSKCFRAGYCVERLCSVHKAHVERVAYLSTGAQYVKIKAVKAKGDSIMEKKVKTVNLKPNAYKAVMRYLDKISLEASAQGDRAKALVIDNITVQMEIIQEFTPVESLKAKYPEVYLGAARVYEKYNKEAILNGYQI